MTANEKETVTAGAVIDAMEAWAPSGWAYPWDKTGLNIGSARRPVSRVLVCLTLTDEALGAAMEAGAEMIVSHHPALWEPLKRLSPDDPVTARCIRAFNAGITCYSSHTNLDVAPGGVNHVLAATLGLQDLAPLFPVPHAGLVKLATFVPEAHLDGVRTALANAGAGIIGEYTECSFSSEGVGTFRPSAAANPFSGTRDALNLEPERKLEMLLPKAKLGDVLKALTATHPYEEPAYDVFPLENAASAIGLGLIGKLAAPLDAQRLADHVRQALHLDHVRLTGANRTDIQRVAVLGGAGGGEVAKLPAGIDAYVTGDVKYHDAWTAVEREVTLIDAGHFGTEIGIVPVIADRLRKQFPSLKVVTYSEPPVFQLISGGAGHP